MPAIAGPTLGSLRQKMAVRLGYATMMGALGDTGRAFDGWLQAAQDELWLGHSWPELQRDLAVYCDAGQGVVDWPDDCDPTIIAGVWVAQGGDSYWRPLRERPVSPSMPVPLSPDVLVEGPVPTAEAFGDAPPLLLDPAAGQWAPIAANRAPERMGRVEWFERREQLTLYPAPQLRCAVWLRYLPRPGKFTEDKDTLFLPQDVVLEQAIAWAKAHYGHADAPAQGKKAIAMMARRRGNAHGNRRYHIEPIGGCNPGLVSPQVTTTPNGGLLVPVVGAGRC